MCCRLAAGTQVRFLSVGQLCTCSQMSCHSTVGLAAWLSEQKATSEVDPLFAELASWDLAVAGTRLREWAGEEVVGEAVGDGLFLGRLSRSDLDDESALLTVAARLSAAYLGLEGPFKAPYFDVAA